MLFINQSAYYFCLCLQSRDLAWISLGISAIQNENNLHMNSKVGMKILKNFKCLHQAQMRILQTLFAGLFAPFYSSSWHSAQSLLID